MLDERTIFEDSFLSLETARLETKHLNNAIANISNTIEEIKEASLVPSLEAVHSSGTALAAIVPDFGTLVGVHIQDGETGKLKDPYEFTNSELVETMELTVETAQGVLAEVSDKIKSIRNNLVKRVNVDHNAKMRELQKLEGFLDSLSKRVSKEPLEKEFENKEELDISKELDFLGYSKVFSIREVAPRVTNLYYTIEKALEANRMALSRFLDVFSLSLIKSLETYDFSQMSILSTRLEKEVKLELGAEINKLNQNNQLGFELRLEDYNLASLVGLKKLKVDKVTQVRTIKKEEISLVIDIAKTFVSRAKRLVERVVEHQDVEKEKYIISALNSKADTEQHRAIKTVLSFNIMNNTPLNHSELNKLMIETDIIKIYSKLPKGITITDAKWFDENSWNVALVYFDNYLVEYYMSVVYSYCSALYKLSSQQLKISNKNLAGELLDSMEE